jgi:hypothetical protein
MTDNAKKAERQAKAKLQAAAVTSRLVAAQTKLPEGNGPLRQPNAPTVYVTLTDLRRSFVEVQRVLSAGAQVIVLKRGVPVATLSMPDDLLRQSFE